MNLITQILQPVNNALTEWSIITQWEYNTYINNHFTTYYAESGLMTVFIDNTERSPTFRLLPLDTVHQTKRQCYVQIWTNASDHLTAWYSLLHRNFTGLDSLEYKKIFNETITDNYLLAAAMRSLPNATSQQQHLYDFSFNKKNIERCGANNGDLGVIALLYEEINDIQLEDSSVSRFIRHMIDANGRVAIIGITDKSPANTVRDEIKSVLVSRHISTELVHIAIVTVSRDNDPLRYRSQLALKILLNTHSTGVMARMGRVVHQTMTNVSPSNLKLIGRATALIQSHVNTALAALNQSVSYQVCNAVLFDTIAHVKQMSAATQTASIGGQSAEVAVSIIRILSSLHTHQTVSFQSALNILNRMSLEEYLLKWEQINPIEQ